MIGTIRKEKIQMFINETGITISEMADKIDVLQPNLSRSIISAKISNKLWDKIKESYPLFKTVYSANNILGEDVAINRRVRLAKIEYPEFIALMEYISIIPDTAGLLLNYFDNEFLYNHDVRKILVGGNNSTDLDKDLFEPLSNYLDSKKDDIEKLREAAKHIINAQICLESLLKTPPGE